MIGDWIGLLFVVVVIYMLVRPRSPAAELVDSISAMVVAIVRRATDIA